MAGATTPDGIGFAQTGDVVTIAAATALVASTTQTALALRQRYEFVWANAAARTTQAGMVTGSTGYQADTKSEYIYDSSAWRLRTPYAEYSATAQSIPTGGGETGLINFSQTVSQTTDTTFTSVATNVLTLVQPGVYAMSLTFALTASGTGAYGIFRASGVAVSTGVVAGSVITIPLPFYRTTAANSQITMAAFQNSGSSASTSALLPVLRVGRLG